MGKFIKYITTDLFLREQKVQMVILYQDWKVVLEAQESMDYQVYLEIWEKKGIRESKDKMDYQVSKERLEIPVEEEWLDQMAGKAAQVLTEEKEYRELKVFEVSLDVMGVRDLMEGRERRELEELMESKDLLEHREDQV